MRALSCSSASAKQRGQYPWETFSKVSAWTGTHSLPCFTFLHWQHCIVMVCTSLCLVILVIYHRRV